jgi:hypothetical protein
MWLLLILLGAAGIYGWAQFILSFHHIALFGPSHNAPGTDWMVYYGAIRAAVSGNLALVYDSFRFTDYLNASFRSWLSSPLPFHPWLYPPTFLLLLLPFGYLSFGVSYAAFQAITFAGLAAAIWRGARDRSAAWLPVLALGLCPAASINVFAGQNAFMTGGLLVGGVRLLEHNPYLAGVLLGILTYKPQFCLMIPVALVAARAWRALLTTIATAVAVALITIPVFGIAPWIHWVSLLATPSADFYQNWMEWSRMYGLSVYTCVALIGGTNGVANAAQLAAFLLAAVVVYWSFSRPMHAVLRMTVLLAATILAAPHVSPYDLVLLTIAATLYFLRYNDSGFLPGEIVVMACVWLIPLANPPRATPVGLLTPLLVCALIVCAMIRATREALSDQVAAASPH